MRRPNGYGGIVKLSGKRRKPYQVRLTAGWENYVDDDGNVKTRQIIHILGSYPTYKDASMALALYNNDPYDISLKGITFEEAYAAALEKKMPLAENTLKGYNTAYRKAAKLYKKQLVKIRKSDLQILIDNEDTAVKQRHLIGLFKLIFNWAEKDIELIRDNPCKHVTVTAEEKATKKGCPYSPEEIKMLWRNLYKIPYVDSVLLQIYTGMRITEMLSLKKENINLKERYVYVEGTKNESSKRFVPLRREIIPLLQKMMENDGDVLFYTKTGMHMKREHYHPLLNKVKDELKLSHTSHDARHTFISRADDSGIQENALKTIVGHTLTGVTGKVYTHKEISTLIREVDKIKFF